METSERRVESIESKAEKSEERADKHHERHMKYEVELEKGARHYSTHTDEYEHEEEKSKKEEDQWKGNRLENMKEHRMAHYKNCERHHKEHHSGSPEIIIKEEMERGVERITEGTHVGELKVYGAVREMHKMGLGKETFLLSRLDSTGCEKLYVWKFSP